MAAEPSSHRHESARADTPPPRPATVRVLDRRSVRAVDRAAIDEFGLPGIVLMENAARGLATEALAMIGPPRAPVPGAEPDAAEIVIVCGSGNNGGDGYALARHLHNAGRGVSLVVVAPPRPGTDAAVNHEVCRRMGLAMTAFDAIAAAPPPAPRLVVDAVLGTGLDRPLEPPMTDVIAWINDLDRPVLSVDLPSGLDADTGLPLGAAVRATRTGTFVGLKPGLIELTAQPFTGEVVVIDIGAPRELVERFGRLLPDPRGPAGE